jgi:hypothetical protein
MAGRWPGGRDPRRLSVDDGWLEQHTSQAPPTLRARVLEYAGAAAAPTLPSTLAAAAQSALTRVLSHPGDRSVALDLLAADALITLALLAQAETAPERLEEFAGSVLHNRQPAS